ncbi:hypothetical protein EDE15_3525 [Edaphobacter aggregans]|uniref:Uncharacterized protein n=1 Tax=Edaphobacter aggregans TaxID=570835 RepID=A0A3R9QJH5_9BACT|nr:hypothetical protein EDE15_3525 [Edaphobacter aggregans]
MSELESNEGLLQLGDAPTQRTGASGSEDYGVGEKIQANSDGNSESGLGRPS